MQHSVVTVDLALLDKYLICRVCKDYFIHAVTINECLHTFCKGCLEKCVAIRNECPHCRIDLGLNPFANKVIYDRNIQALVDKILPDHAADSANKAERKKEQRIDLVTLFPDTQEETEEADAGEPFEVVVRAMPTAPEIAARTMPPLVKPLLKMTSSVMVYKLAQFIHKRLSDQQVFCRADQIELLVDGKVVGRSRTFGGLVRRSEVTSIAAPLIVSYRKKL